MRAFTIKLLLLIPVLFASSAAFGAVSGFSELPNLTAYLECRTTTCTMTDLVQNAENDAGNRLPGTYEYLLGDVATEELALYQITYTLECAETRNIHYGDLGPECVRWSRNFTVNELTLPPDYVTQFGQYATYAGEGPITVHVPINITPTLPSDIAAEADVSSYLRGLPYFSNIFVDAGHPVVTVIFSDGSSAKFVLLDPTAEPGLAFGYVPGSAKDKNGNPISDQQLISGNTQSGTINVTEYAGWANLEGGDLVITGVPVNVDWQDGGTVTVGPLCDSNGNCVLDLNAL